MVEAHPLQWPVGWPRSNRPTRSRFDCTFAAARDGIINEIRLMQGRNPIISTNNELRRDGLPYANQRQPEDTGVAVYFEYKGQQIVFACDKWDRIEHNLQAVRKTVDAMRGVERWGVSDMLERAFTGFTALPEAGEVWWQILEVANNANGSEIKKAYRMQAAKYHPDNQITGNADTFLRVKKAYDDAMKNL